MRIPQHVNDPALAEVVADVIGEAFAQLAVSRFLIPDDEARQRLLTLHLHQMVAAAQTHGVVLADDRFQAVAVWFNVTAAAGLPEIADYEQRRKQFLGEHDERFAMFEEAMHTNHPGEVDHWYLALMAVRPARQSEGLGGALLDYQHSWLDQAGSPTYLEAADLRSRHLYHRHGYRDWGKPFPCNPGGPLLYPMWREPGTM